MEVFFVSLLNGLVYGMLLFMLASGLTLIFSMMGVLNFAHASAYMLGAYFAYTLSLYVGFWWALLLAPVLCGLFGAGIVGLVGASIGDAIAPGDNGQALGGASGRAFGLLGGAYLGSSMGVWGASRLFEKPVHPGWAFLGSGLGTLVGGGAATGILFALQDDKQTAGGLAVASVFLFQVAGAVLFTEVGMPDTGVLGQPTR